MNHRELVLVMLKKTIGGEIYFSRYQEKKKPEAESRARILRSAKRKVRVLKIKNMYHVMVGPMR